MTVADVDVVDVRVGFEGEEEPDEVGSGEQDGHCVHQGSVGHRKCHQCHQDLPWTPQGWRKSLGWRGEHDQTQEVPSQCGDSPVPIAVDTHWTWL